MVSLRRYIITLLVGILIGYGDGDGELIYPSPKNWWAKKITGDLFTAGRLTAEQYKYAYETGFRTIISQFTFESIKQMGEDVLVTTDIAKQTLNNFTDIKFHVLLKPGENWATLDTLRKFRPAFESSPKPVLYHCGSAYSASFIALLHLSNISRSDPSAEPKIDIEDIFRRGSALGYDYNKPALLDMAVNITGQPAPANPATPEVSVKEWNRPLWLFKPVLNKWFISGQIRKSIIHFMDVAGYKTVVNVRQGAVTSDVPSQEEVPLINIRDGTGTYASGGRQSKARLQATRIHPKKSTRYVSPTATVNYASRNPQCFGDDIGYNEALERKAIKKESPMHYIHLPVPRNTSDWKATWEDYKAELKAASELDDPVLIHCDDLFRSGVMALLAAGHESGRGAAWASRRAAELGVALTPDDHAHVLDVFTEILGSAASPRSRSFMMMPIYIIYVILDVLTY